jgi:hypothetical protein
MARPSGPPVARSAVRPDLVLGFAAVAATATVGTWAGRTAFPLLTDEAGYLADACNLVSFASLAWGPLYAALYCALRHVSDDPFGVFWAKQAAVPLAAGALFDRLGLAYGLGPLLSPLAALWCVLALLVVVNGTNEFAILLGLTARHLEPLLPLVVVLVGTALKTESDEAPSGLRTGRWLFALPSRPAAGHVVRGPHVRSRGAVVSRRLDRRIPRGTRGGRGADRSRLGRQGGRAKRRAPSCPPVTSRGLRLRGERGAGRRVPVHPVRSSGKAGASPLD